MKNINVGSKLIYQKCSCGDVDLTVGKEYEVIGIKYPMIIFLDDKGKKRVKSLNTRCFKQ